MAFRKSKKVKSEEIKKLLFTLIKVLYGVRKTLIDDYGISEIKANIAIAIAIDVERQISLDRE